MFIVLNVKKHSPLYFACEVSGLFICPLSIHKKIYDKHLLRCRFYTLIALFAMRRVLFCFVVIFKIKRRTKVRLLYNTIRCEISILRQNKIYVIKLCFLITSISNKYFLFTLHLPCIYFCYKEIFIYASIFLNQKFEIACIHGK